MDPGPKGFRSRRNCLSFTSLWRFKFNFSSLLLYRFLKTNTRVRNKALYDGERLMFYNSPSLPRDRTFSDYKL